MPPLARPTLKKSQGKTELDHKSQKAYLEFFYILYMA